MLNKEEKQLAKEIQEIKNEIRNKAIFTDKELEYIYCYLETSPLTHSEYICDTYKIIEKKIRKQIKKYRELDKKRT